MVDSKTFQSFRLSGKKGGRRRVRTDGVRSGADDRKDEVFQKLEKNYDFSRNSNKVPVDYQSKVLPLCQNDWIVLFECNIL